MPACCRTSALRTRATLMLSKGGSGLYKLQQEHLNYSVYLYFASRPIHGKHHRSRSLQDGPMEFGICVVPPLEEWFGFCQVF